MQKENHQEFITKDFLQESLQDFADTILAGMYDMYNKLDRRLMNVEERLMNVEGRLTNVEERLTSVEWQVDSLNRKFEAQQVRLDRHDSRISKLEKIHPNGKHSLPAY
ncbi:MAG: hypothetical protein KatS3mg088_450 [Patescibacteria group bacterium]|nr:MAG: hypothetical protein KatS3mg088_450 [Patescibacteria group bacterium]